MRILGRFSVTALSYSLGTRIGTPENPANMWAVTDIGDGSLYLSPFNSTDMKFNIGDKVEIINYGHIIWHMQDDKLVAHDMSPELIGQQGIITDAHQTQGKDTYALQGPNKAAWYDNGQLKLIQTNPNT